MFDYWYHPTKKSDFDFRFVIFFFLRTIFKNQFKWGINQLPYLWLTCEFKLFNYQFKTYL